MARMSSTLPARTVGAILWRHGVPRLAECDPLTGEVLRSSRTTGSAASVPTLATSPVSR